MPVFIDLIDTFYITGHFAPQHLTVFGELEFKGSLIG